MNRLFAIFLRPLIAAVLVVSIVGIGFSHKSPQPELTPELAEFVAAGGSLSDVCGGFGGNGPIHMADCEACRLTDSFILLRDCVFTTTAVEKQVLTFRFVAKVLAQSQGLDPARLTRAPPLA